MSGFPRRSLVLPVAIAVVAAAAVVALWQTLRTDHERRVANVAEATSYATRSELARRLIEQFQSLRTLGDYRISSADDPDQFDVETPLQLIRFEGVDVIAWGEDDGTRYLADGDNPVSGYVPSDAEWAPIAPLVAEALTSGSEKISGPFMGADGHASLRYYLPLRRGPRRGALVATIDAHDLLEALLVDEALGYEIRVSCCDGIELYRRGRAEDGLPDAWVRDGWIAPTRGIRWNVSHRPTPDLADDLETSAVDSVLIVGLALALLLGGLVFETRRANERALAAKAAEQRVRNLNRELEDRVVARTQKLDNVLRDLDTINLSISHDLRSPLNTISLAVGALQESSRDEATTRWLEKIALGVKRMATMMDRLLGYSRAASFESERQDVDMRELVLDVLREKGIDVSSVDIGELPRARVDRVITHILFRNLLANAVRHGRTNRALMIEIGSLMMDNGLHAYFVRDNGPGLDPALAEKLFRPLPDRPESAGVAGLGLGLTIAARAVERHGGRIWVESQPGLGATFFFTLSAPPRPDDDQLDD